MEFDFLKGEMRHVRHEVWQTSLTIETNPTDMNTNTVEFKGKSCGSIVKVLLVNSILVVALSVLVEPNTCLAQSLGFAPPANYVTASLQAVAVGDFNGDARPDVVVANYYLGSVTIFLCNANGTLTQGSSFAVVSTPDAIAVGDFNQDGRLDLAVANQFGANISILLGNGNGTFIAAVNYTVGLQPMSVAVADFNGDFRPDLVVANFDNNNVSVLLGNGNGAFAPAVNYAVGAGPHSVAAGDFNGDGRADLITANRSGNNVSVLLGNGNGTFGNAVNYAAGNTPLAVAVGDFNRDGRLDLAVANEVGNNVSVLLGNGNGTFAAPVNYGVGTEPHSIIAGDYNGDGRPDLAVANYSGNVSVLLGNGNGTFATAINFAAGSSLMCIAAGDFNGDGLRDLAVATFANNNALSILLNQTTLPPTLTGAVNVNVTRLAGNHAETAVAINPANPDNIVVFCFNPSASGLVRAFSVNGGLTWTIGTIATGTDIAAACCDPSAAFDRFGNLYLTYINSALDSIVVVRSIDGGNTFATVHTFTVGYQQVDQQTVVTGPGNVAGQQTVWITFKDFSANAIVASGAIVTGLGAMGAFSAPQQAPGSAAGNFGDIAIGPNGQVMVTYQDNAFFGGEGPANIFVNLDPDGPGPAGFNNAVIAARSNVGGFDVIPAQPHRSIDAEAGLAWDRTGGARNGRIYLLYTDESPNEGNNTEIRVRFSDNNGTSWSDAVRVNDDNTLTSQFLPRIALDQTSGDVAVSWYDCANDGVNNRRTQFFATISTDGGRTFVPNAQISAGISDEMNANYFFDYGDYTGLFFHNGFFFPAWADNSNSTGDNPDGATTFDVYTAKIFVLY